MFSIDNDKPQALGALIRREAPKPQAKPVEIKPGLTMVDGKMSFDPALSANPPAPKPEPPKPVAVTVGTTYTLRKYEPPSRAYEHYLETRRREEMVRYMQQTYPQGLNAQALGQEWERLNTGANLSQQSLNELMRCC